MLVSKVNLPAGICAGLHVRQREADVGNGVGRGRGGPRYQEVTERHDDQQHTSHSGQSYQTPVILRREEETSLESAALDQCLFLCLYF